MNPMPWDWHGFALDLACKGFPRSEIYGRICAHSEQVGNQAPKRSTMTNYLRKHKHEWAYASKDRPLQDPEPPKNREFRNLKNATIRAARELYYAPIYISPVSYTHLDVYKRQVATLDRARIINADMTVRPRYWEVNGKSGYKAYLKVLHVTIEEEDPWADAYAQYDEQ